MRLMFVVLAIWFCLPVTGERAPIQPATNTRITARAGDDRELGQGRRALALGLHAHVGSLCLRGCSSRRPARRVAGADSAGDSWIKLKQARRTGPDAHQFVNNGAVDGCIVLHGARLASAVVSGSFASELLSYPDLFREDYDHGHGS